MDSSEIFGNSHYLANVDCFYRNLDAYDWIIFLNTDDFLVIETVAKPGNKVVFMDLIQHESEMYSKDHQEKEISTLRISWDEYEACCFRDGDAPRFEKQQTNVKSAVRTQSEVRDVTVHTGGVEGVVSDLPYDRAQVMHLKCDYRVSDLEAIQDRLESSNCAGNIDAFLNIEY